MNRWNTGGLYELQDMSEGGEDKNVKILVGLFFRNQLFIFSKASISAKTSRLSDVLLKIQSLNFQSLKVAFFFFLPDKIKMQTFLFCDG